MGRIVVHKETHSTLRGFIFLVLTLVLGVGSLFAAEVKLKNGKTYYSTTILEQTDESIRITVPYGQIELPLGEVESIDGVTVVEPTPGPALTTSSNVPPAKATSPALPPPPPAYMHRLTMDFFLLGVGLTMMVWIAALIWVQHDVRGMPERVRRAIAIARCRIP